MQKYDKHYARIGEDSMYKVARIKFKPLIKGEAEILDKIDAILSMLYKNGQILDEWIVESRDQCYIANVVTTDDDSLDGKYSNSYIHKEIKNFDVDTEIICDDPMATDSCHCGEHSYYILAIHPDDSSSPIICGDCGKEVPLIHIPYIYNEKEHYSILNFQKTYKAVDTLWMDSLSDRFTKRQIVDHKSQLNKIGADIGSELEKKLDKPVYYLLCNPIGGWFEFGKNNKNLKVCPKCEGEFSKINNTYADKVCHNCRLAFYTVESNEKM